MKVFHLYRMEYECEPVYVATYATREAAAQQKREREHAAARGGRRDWFDVREDEAVKCEFCETFTSRAGGVCSKCVAEYARHEADLKANERR